MCQSRTKEYSFYYPGKGYVSMRGCDEQIIAIEGSLKGSTLENTDRSTYLGVTIRNDLKWEDHINLTV